MDGGAAGRARVRAQLGRVLSLLQQHLGCPLGRGTLGPVTWGEAGSPFFLQLSPLCSQLCQASPLLPGGMQAHPLSFFTLGLQSLTSSV